MDILNMSKEELIEVIKRNMVECYEDYNAHVIYNGYESEIKFQKGHFYDYGRDDDGQIEWIEDDNMAYVFTFELPLEVRIRLFGNLFVKVDEL